MLIQYTCMYHFQMAKTVVNNLSTKAPSSHHPTLIKCHKIMLAIKIDDGRNHKSNDLKYLLSQIGEGKTHHMCGPLTYEDM